MDDFLTIAHSVGRGFRSPTTALSRISHFSNNSRQLKYVVTGETTARVPDVVSRGARERNVPRVRITCISFQRIARVTDLTRALLFDTVNWVVDHGKFTRVGRGGEFYDYGSPLYYAARAQKLLRWPLPVAISRRTFRATACARVNEAFVIRKQRLLGARMTEARFFLFLLLSFRETRYFLIPAGGEI